MKRLGRILKWTGLTFLAAIALLFAWSGIYGNTPLGCYIEQDHPPLKPGTPEYAAMQAAAREGPRGMVAPSGGLGVRAYLYTDEYPITGRDRVYLVKQDARDFWFIQFHPKHEKSLFGCDKLHFDGAWTAIVRKSDLMLMNRKGEEFN